MNADPDVLAALKRCGTPIGADETVELWHATTAKSVRQIASSGEMLSDEWGHIYFSTDETIAEDLNTMRDVDTLLSIRVSVEDLCLSPAALDRLRADLIVQVKPGQPYRPAYVGDSKPWSRGHP